MRKRFAAWVPKIGDGSARNPVRPDIDRIPEIRLLNRIRRIFNMIGIGQIAYYSWSKIDETEDKIKIMVRIHVPKKSVEVWRRGLGCTAR